MRYSIFFSYLCFFCFPTFHASAQQTHSPKAGVKQAVTRPLPGKTETITVYGNCGMCKERIEGAVKDEKGLFAADWSEETKLLTVRYDDKTISMDDIQQKIAAVGHDTDKYRAKDSVYKKLHKCCKYDRPKG